MSIIPVEISHTRRREIDGLRGLACIIVIIGHISQRFRNFYFVDMDIGPLCKIMSDTICAAGSGVYLFFAISGYLMGRSMRQIPSLSLHKIATFYVHRAARIFPPYFIVLGSTWLALTLSGWIPQRINQFQTHPDSLTESLLASIACLHQVLYGTFPRLFPPGWTIEVEVHFYILAPFVCLGLTLLIERRRLGAASACILSSGGAVALASLAAGNEWLQHSLLVFLPLFLLGVVAHSVEQQGWRPLSNVIPALGWPAFIVFGMMQPWMSGLGMEISVRMLLIAIMFGALASGRGTFFRLCTHPILAWAGIVSYSAYLVHLQITQIVFLAVEKYLSYLNPIIMAVVAISLTSILVVCGTITFYIVIERGFARHYSLIRKSHLFQSILVVER